MKRTTLHVLLTVVTLAACTATFAQSTTTRITRTATTTTTTTTTAKPINDKSRDTLELVFVLDTTGSMGGLIDGAKQRIWGIINEVMQKPSKPRVRVGLVAYRDIGDEYVTKLLPITEDLDKAYTTLMDYQAGGGGDTPENVRKALAEGVRNAGWSKAGRGLAQIVFLVGDAPPQNYAQEPDVLVTTAEAVRKNMIVNTIQCGSIGGTKEIWQTIALRGEGKYFAIAQDGGVQAITTPFDAKLAELAAKNGRTYLSYGEKKSRDANTSLQMSAEMRIDGAASATAKADRAVNKAVNSFQYDGDLVQDVENEKIKVKDVKTEDLPEDLQKLSVSEREKVIAGRIEERKKIRAEILELSKQRDAYITAERKKLGQQNGFDTAVAQALKEQLLKKGIK
ncbi:MAG: VWA domain-containing protein [Pyrinomonadaceae bacterium]|nr:VWA domain-containing protein [Blastocatellia bacterium]MCW5955681.1 VWA domain-containing protein [Pyrinomonadaceae bacterium]